jgi:hypothetical protein
MVKKRPHQTLFQNPYPKQQLAAAAVWHIFHAFREVALDEVF